MFPNLKDRLKTFSYNVLSDTLKSRFSKILNRDQCITTHTFRKTGYLFSRWGGGDMDSIMKSARHFNFQTAQLYMDDEVQLNFAEAHDSNAKFKVPRFNMSIMFNEAGGRRTNEDTLEHFPTI